MGFPGNSIIRVVDLETTGKAPPAEVCEIGYCDLDATPNLLDDDALLLCLFGMAMFLAGVLARGLFGGGQS